MKAPRRRLLIAVGLAVVIVSPWLLFPSPQASFYELMFRLGPSSKREWFVEQLEGLGANGAPALISLLADEPGWQPGRVGFQSELSEALLDGMPESLPALANALEVGDPSARRCAAAILAHPRDPGLWGRVPYGGGMFAPHDEPHFEKGGRVLCRDTFDASYREFDRQAQARATYKPLIPVLLRGLEDPEPEVRGHCLLILACFPEAASAVLPRALLGIRSKDGVLASGSRALVRSQGKDAVPELKRLLEAFLEELEGLPPQSKAELEEQARDADRFLAVPNAHPLHSAAAFAIEILGNHEALEDRDLIRALRHPEGVLRGELIQILARRQDCEAIVSAAGFSPEETERLRQEICEIRIYRLLSAERYVAERYASARHASVDPESRPTLPRTAAPKGSQ